MWGTRCPHPISNIRRSARRNAHYSPPYPPQGHWWRPYIDPVEPIWDIYRHIGFPLFLLGFLLLLYDFLVLNRHNPLYYNNQNLFTFFHFITNSFHQYHGSDMSIAGNNQPWFLFLWLGMGFTILGEAFTNKPRKNGEKA